MLNSNIQKQANQSLRPRRKCVLYARVSSKEQQREGFSIPAQQKLLRQYAKDNGLLIAKEFCDVETAGRAGRKGFTEMVRHLKVRANRIILVEKTDRLHRNLKDWLTIDELHAEIHLVKEGVVLTEDSVSAEKFIFGVQSLMAKNYIDNLREETKKGMLEKARQGYWPNCAPVGYRNVMGPNGKRIIEPDPKVAPLITKLFERYASGEVGLTALTEEAAAMGLRTPRSRRSILSVVDQTNRRCLLSVQVRGFVTGAKCDTTGTSEAKALCFVTSGFRFAGLRPEVA